MVHKYKLHVLYVGVHSDARQNIGLLHKDTLDKEKYPVIELHLLWPERLNLHNQQWPWCKYRNHWFCWILFLHYPCFSIFLTLHLFGSLAHWTLSGIACKCRFPAHCSIRSESSWAKTGRKYSRSVCACVCEIEEKVCACPYLLVGIASLVSQ